MKSIFNKNGQPSKRLIDALRNSKKGDVFRPVSWMNKGRTLRDYTHIITAYLNHMGIMYEIGNDAPRGGKEGIYIKPAQEIELTTV